MCTIPNSSAHVHVATMDSDNKDSIFLAEEIGPEEDDTLQCGSLLKQDYDKITNFTTQTIIYEEKKSIIFKKSQRVIFHL